MASRITLRARVKKLNGHLVVYIPLNAGGRQLAEVTRGLSDIEGKRLKIVIPGWLAEAGRFLEARPDVAVVCGRLRERRPEASIYNQLCDIEWNTPVGEARACGGIAMMRVNALRAAGGFVEALIAGRVQ